MKEISLTQGQVTLVDEEDHEELSKFPWHAMWNACTGSFYAIRKFQSANGKRAQEWMHRRILGLAHGDTRQVDHLNHDTLDNRRANLRAVTGRENSENRKDRSKHGTGVSFDERKAERPFRLRVHIDGKKHQVGYFPTAEAALEARQKWLKLKGES